MKDAIKKQLKEIYPDQNTDSWQILVWYIAALDGLASVYQGYLSQKMEYSGVNFRESLRRFAIGVNRGADYNFNFIDVGGGKDLKLKEITDAKLRETFKMSKCCPQPMLPHHYAPFYLLVLVGTGKRVHPLTVCHQSASPLSARLLCRLPRRGLRHIPQPLQA